MTREGSWGHIAAIDAVVEAEALDRLASRAEPSSPTRRQLSLVCLMCSRPASDRSGRCATCGGSIVVDAG